KKPVLDKRLGLSKQIENTMKLDDIKNLYTKAQEEVERVHDEQKILTLKMDRYIAKYIGMSDPNFIAIIRRSIDLYKWIQQKNSRKELLMVEEKILIEEKLEDERSQRIIDNVNDSSTKKKMDNRIRVAEMTLNKSELEVLSGENLEEAENKTALLYAEYGYLDYGVEDTKEMISLFNKKEKFFKDKTDKSKKPVLEETLVLKANLNIEDKDKMVVDKYIKPKQSTKSLEDSKILKKDRELIFPIAPNIRQGRINRHKQAYGLALTGGILKRNQDLNNLEGEEMNNNIGKKELDHLWNIIQNAIIKAANQTLPKKKILNTGCSRKRSKIKTELEKSILVLGKIIRGIHDGKLDLEIGLLQLQSLDEGEQDLRG
ncbi:39199_t:CDS:2, partial [Gigaspora margarita]